MAVLGFNFPPDSGEKVTLEITVLMSLTMFMNMVAGMQPPSSETPLIGTGLSILRENSIDFSFSIFNVKYK